MKKKNLYLTSFLLLLGMYLFASCMGIDSLSGIWDEDNPCSSEQIVKTYEPTDQWSDVSGLEPRNIIAMANHEKGLASIIGEENVPEVEWDSVTVVAGRTYSLYSCYSITTQELREYKSGYVLYLTLEKTADTRTSYHSLAYYSIYPKLDCKPIWMVTNYK